MRLDLSDKLQDAIKVLILFTIFLFVICYEARFLCFVFMNSDQLQQNLQYRPLFSIRRHKHVQFIIIPNLLSLSK